jgi:hypothetical protein
MIKAFKVNVTSSLLLAAIEVTFPMSHYDDLDYESKETEQSS